MQRIGNKFLKSILILFVSLICTQAAMAIKQKPSLASYIEPLMTECTRWDDPAFCEKELTQQYKLAPFISPEDFILKVLKQRDLSKIMTVVSRNDLSVIASKIKQLPINFEYEFNGCDNRAAAISYFLESRERVKTLNVHVKGHLKVQSHHLPLENAQIKWGYHVAPVILVKENTGQLQLYSLDFTLLGEPRPALEWLHLVTAQNPILSEISLLSGYQTFPGNTGDDLPNDWTPSQKEKLEADLHSHQRESLTRRTPVHRELAIDFKNFIFLQNFVLNRPYVRGGSELDLSPLADRFSTNVIEQIKTRTTNELRCFGEETMTCGLFFYNNEGEYCEITAVYLPQKRSFVAQNTAPHITCYGY